MGQIALAVHSAAADRIQGVCTDYMPKAYTVFENNFGKYKPIGTKFYRET